MYKVLLLFTFVAILYCSGTAQTVSDGFIKISSFVDANGKVDGGYVDLDYSPLDPLMVTFDVGDSYSLGTVYLNNGDVMDGLLKYSSTGKKLLFKAKQGGDYDNAKRIRPEECLGFRIMTDTFTVINNFTVIKKKGEFALSDKPSYKDFKDHEFVEVLGQHNGCKLYKFVDVTSNGSVVSNYFIMEDSEQKLTDVSDENRDWNEVTQPLQQSVSISKANEESYRRLFKESEVNELLAKSQTLKYTKYLEELKEPDKAYCYEAAVSKGIGNWQYFFTNQDADLLMISNYKSLVPFEKNDVSRYFYPNGQLRKTTVFFDGELVCERHCHPNGALHYELVQNPIERKESVVSWFNKVSQYGSIQYFGGDSESVYKKDGKLYDYNTDREIATEINRHLVKPKVDEELVTIYLNVCDSLGNRLLDANGCGTEVCYDEVSKREIHREYKKNQLESAYFFNEKGEKFYQYCEKLPSVISYSSFSKRLHTELKNSMMAKEWHAFPQGVFFLRLLINEKGQRVGFSIDNVQEKQLLDVLGGYWYNVSREMTFKTARHNDEKVMSELVIPVLISVKGFSPVPVNNNSMWMMQQQQMHMMQMNNFSAPMRF